MWAVYLLMVFTRLNAGWRGRRAALLASVGLRYRDRRLDC